MFSNVSKTDVFQLFQNKDQYKINHQLNRNDKCLISLLSCKVCGLHYVGSITDKFGLRRNNYKENIQKTKRGGGGGGLGDKCSDLFLCIFL